MIFYKTLYIRRLPTIKTQLNHVKADWPSDHEKTEELNSIWTLYRQFSNLFGQNHISITKARDIVFCSERRFFNSTVRLREQSIRLRIGIFESNRAFLNGLELCTIPLLKIYTSYCSCILKSLQNSYTLIVKTKNYPYGSSKSIFLSSFSKTFYRSTPNKILSDFVTYLMTHFGRNL